MIFCHSPILDTGYFLPQQVAHANHLHSLTSCMHCCQVEQFRDLQLLDVMFHHLVHQVTGFTCSHFCFWESGRVAIVVVSVASLTMDARPVVYKVIECTCGAKWYWWGVPDDTDVGLPHVRLQIISHTMSEGHTAMSLEDIAAMRWMYAPNARCRCYGRKDCSPRDDRRILCEHCGRWFRRRIAGGSDSSLSQRDYSPMSSLSN